MKLNLKSKYLGRDDRLCESEILIEHKKLIFTLKPIGFIYTDYIPLNENEFLIEKLLSTDKNVNDYNRKITYIGKRKDNQTLYLNVDKYDLFKLKFMFKGFWIQEKSFLKDITLLIIGVFLGVILGYFSAK